MKKLLFTFAIALGAVSCFGPHGELEGIAHVPGVEPGKGNNYNSYTTYKGALLPNPEFGGREDMVHLLELIGKQKGDIDDNAFETLLTEKIFECTDRFMYIHDPDEVPSDYWSYAGEWVGGMMYFDLSMYENGEFFVRERFPLTGEAWLNESGYMGYHRIGKWEYDAETDTLYTSEDKSYAAKVLYFDGEFAVLEGFVYPMWLYNPNEHQYKRNTPMELYGFKFSDGKENYLDGYEITPEDLGPLKEKWYEENMYFEGKLLPNDSTSARECFNLVSTANPEEVEDSRMISILTKRRLECKARYVTRDDLDHWIHTIVEYHDVVDRVSACSDMLGNADGSYLTKIKIHPFNEKYEETTKANRYGWYREGEWSYDADSNTLTTIIDNTEYKARVVYIDIAKSLVILRGNVGFLFDAGNDDEILDCRFDEDGMDDYLNGYTTYDEFVEYWLNM